MDNISQYIEECNNYQTVKYLLVTNQKVQEYNNIAVSISGGSDSDIMIDMFTKCDDDKKVKYVFFNTGLEYQATKNHLDFLEKKYNIKIDREKAIKSIPTSCKQYGQPFLSKHVSEMMSRLQRHEFKWEDKSYEELIKEYPKCKSALDWWCNTKGENSTFNISRNKLLKEFIILNPPNFKISNKCCKYAKKDVGLKYNKINNIKLNVVGVRKAEGGVRATRYKNCFDKKIDSYDQYRPLFFFTDKDKLEYKNFFDVKYSDCYEVWGMKRTGCVGCPYGRELQQELELVKQYEPKLYKAVCNVFKDSYTYTEQYYKFREEYKINN
jgi:3'-phosphoadenosine 5'-phosphosulfate sulfotransferase (PAPS reductase)/FAD synthetase